MYYYGGFKAIFYMKQVLLKWCLMEPLFQGPMWAGSSESKEKDKLTGELPSPDTLLDRETQLLNLLDKISSVPWLKIFTIRKCFTMLMDCILAYKARNSVLLPSHFFL